MGGTDLVTIMDSNSRRSGNTVAGNGVRTEEEGAVIRIRMELGRGQVHPERGWWVDCERKKEGESPKNVFKPPRKKRMHAQSWEWYKKIRGGYAIHRHT